jgi:hypothetical protein
MKLRSLLMFLGSLVGALGGVLYWYTSQCVSGNCELGSALFSTLLYGVFIGLFLADLLSQGIVKQVN